MLRSSLPLAGCIESQFRCVSLANVAWPAAALMQLEVDYVPCVACDPPCACLDSSITNYQSFGPLEMGWPDIHWLAGIEGGGLVAAIV